MRKLVTLAGLERFSRIRDPNFLELFLLAPSETTTEILATGPEPLSGLLNSAGVDSLVEQLKQRVIRTVVPRLAEGLLAIDSQACSRASADTRLQQVLDAANVLLFRLMLLLYAEARGRLRPVPGELGLQAIADEIAGLAGTDSRQAATRLGQKYSESTTMLDDRLERLFETARGDGGYGGGLFPMLPGRASARAATDDRLQQAARLLAACKVPDLFLALAIDGLALRRSTKLPASCGRSTMRCSTCAIGSIYEALLDYKLVATGEQPESRSGQREAWVRLCREKSRRRASGSFYTPPAIVEHIVKQTVGAVLDRKLAVLRPEFQAACEADLPQSVINTDSPLHGLFDRLLEIRVLDPAMAPAISCSKRPDAFASGSHVSWPSFRPRPSGEFWTRLSSRFSSVAFTESISTRWLSGWPRPRSGLMAQWMHLTCLPQPSRPRSTIICVRQCPVGGRLARVAGRCFAGLAAIRRRRGGCRAVVGCARCVRPGGGQSLWRAGSPPVAGRHGSSCRASISWLTGSGAPSGGAVRRAILPLGAGISRSVFRFRRKRGRADAAQDGANAAQACG